MEGRGFGGRGGGRGSARGAFGGRGGGFRGGRGRGDGQQHMSFSGGRLYAADDKAFEKEARDFGSAHTGGRGRGRGGDGAPRPPRHNKKDTKVVVMLTHAGLHVGMDGRLVDAFSRGSTTEIHNESTRGMRPDIVHQCLLALFDSDMAVGGRVLVLLSTVKGKTIEINPTMRPPRTFGRFRGLMESLFRDGHITASSGEVLMRITRGSVAPYLPHGADVVALSNSHAAPVLSAVKTAEECVRSPVSDALQGGEKGVLGFFVVSCTDDMIAHDETECITKEQCLSPMPMSPHVACSRLMEGFRVATSHTTSTAQKDAAEKEGPQ